METVSKKHKLSETREHSRAIMLSIQELGKSLTKARHDPLDDVAKFLEELNTTLAKLAEISGREIVDGENGVSISGATLEKKNLILSLSNGNKINVGKVVGEDGFDGEDADEKKVIAKIMKAIPKPLDEEAFLKRVIAKFPKVEQVKISDIIEKIKKNKSLSYKDLTDLPDIMQMIKSELGRFLEHYDASTRARFRPVAGTNVISKMLDVDGSVAPANGQALVWNATKQKYVPGTVSGGGTTVETPTGTPNGVLTTFGTPNTPKWVVADGIVYFEGAGYSYAANTITMDSPPALYIRSIY